MPRLKVRIGWWFCTNTPICSEVKIHRYEFNPNIPTYPWLSILPSNEYIYWNNKGENEYIYWNNKGESHCGRYKLIKFISPTRTKHKKDINFIRLQLKHAKACVRALEQHISDLNIWNKD